MNKILAAEAAWFAGLFEGEGSVGIYDNRPTLRLALHNRDADVINRIKDTLGCGHINGPYYRDDGCVMLFYCLHKTMEIYRVIKMMYPYLGIRRQGQCEIVLDFIQNTNIFKKGNKNS